MTPLYAKHKIGPLLDPDSPDLDAFAKHGGKSLSYHGWADQQVPPESSIEYHAAVVARSSREHVDQYYRLFMVPGMAHCWEEVTAPTASAARGPNLGFQSEYDFGVPFTPENDALTALQRWVEDVGYQPNLWFGCATMPQASLPALCALAPSPRMLSISVQETRSMP